MKIRQHRALLKDSISIKDYPIRFRKNGKTRGRPSKWELYVSRMISEYMQKPEIKTKFQKYVEDMFIYGEAKWPQLPEL